MSDQLSLFDEKELSIPREPPEFYWLICWGWLGPEVGKYVSVNHLMAFREDLQKECYHAGALCKVLEQLPDGQWRCMIDYAGGRKNPNYHFQCNDGKIVILPKENVWFPVYAPDRSGYIDIRNDPEEYRRLREIYSVKVSA